MKNLFSRRRVGSRNPSKNPTSPTQTNLDDVSFGKKPDGYLWGKNTTGVSGWMYILCINFKVLLGFFSAMRKFRSSRFFWTLISSSKKKGEHIFCINIRSAARAKVDGQEVAASTSLFEMTTWILDWTKLIENYCNVEQGL